MGTNLVIQMHSKDLNYIMLIPRCPILYVFATVLNLSRQNKTESTLLSIERGLNFSVSSSRTLRLGQSAPQSCSPIAVYILLCHTAI